MLTEEYKNRIRFLAGILQENHKKEYGALMLQIDYDGWDDFLKDIPKEDLYTEEPGFGYENWPHVTVLFGFHEDADIDKIKKLIKENCKESIEVTLKKISFFDNKDKGYDVVKFDVECDKLHELNKIMSDNFDYTNDYPEYHPHATIAYVLPGKGKEFSEKSKQIKVKCNRFCYSPPDKKKVYFTI